MVVLFVVLFYLFLGLVYAAIRASKLSYGRRDNFKYTSAPYAARSYSNDNNYTRSSPISFGSSLTNTHSNNSSPINDSTPSGGGFDGGSSGGGGASDSF